MGGRSASGYAGRMRLSTVSLLSLLACETAGGDSDDFDTGGDDTAKDTAVDSGDSDSPVGPVEATAWLAVAPATLPDSGGKVTLTARVNKEPAVWTSSTDIVVRWGAEQQADVAVDVLDDATVTLSFVLPELTPGEATLTFTHVRPEGSSLFGTWRLPVSGFVSDDTRYGTGFEATYGQPDAALDAPPNLVATHRLYATDGTPWHSSLSISGGSLVFRGCPADGGACAESVTEVFPSGEIGQVTVDTFESDSGGTTFTAVATDLDEAEKPVIVRVRLDPDSGEFLDLKSSSMAIFGAVLGLNTTKSSPEVPKLLHVSAPSGSGEWIEGDTTYAWTSIGGVKPDAVWNGKAWAGVFTASDLSTDAGETTWTWSVDPEVSPGKVQVSAALPVAGSGAMSTLRQVTIDTALDVALATASGQDLDDDGVPELFVELWAETGETEIWVILNATDKSDKRSPRQLLATPNTGFGFSSPSGNPSLRVAKSSLAGGRDKIRGIREHLPVPLLGRPVPGGDTWLSGEQWDTADILVDDAVEVAPEITGMLGQVAHTIGDSFSSGHGRCFFGQCFAARSTVHLNNGSMRAEASADYDDEMGPGDITLAGLGLDGGSMIVSRGMHSSVGGAVMPIASFVSDAGVAAEASFRIGVGSATVTLPDGTEVDVPAASTVTGTERGYLVNSTVPDAEGRLRSSSLWVTPTDVQAVELGVAMDNPIFLGQNEGGQNVLAFQVAGSGNHAWGTAIDFNTGAFEEQVQLGTVPHTTPYTYMFWLNPKRIISAGAQSPVGLTWSALDTRAADWDSYTPDANGDGVHDVLTPGSATFDDGVFVTVPAESACGWETLYIPPGDTLAARTSAATVFSRSDREDCGDLYLPVTTADSVVDLPPLAILASADGDVIAAIPGVKGVVGQTLLATVDWRKYPKSDPTRLYGGIQSADVNLDGLADLLITDSTQTLLLASTGAGGYGTTAVVGTIAGIACNARPLPGGGGGNAGASVPGPVDAYGTRTFLDADDFPR